MTDIERDKIIEEISAEIKARYRDVPEEYDMEALAMMLQDFNEQAKKRIPDWQ